MTSSTDAAKIKSIAAYNAAADNYDCGFWDPYSRRTVARLGLQKGARVLDVGCGTGTSALVAAETVGLDGSVIAVDLAENMLQRGRAKASALCLNNIEFRVGDMTSLGYPDQHFDAVICVFGIFFVADMNALLAELWRMVKPGGELAITTWGARLFEPLYSQWNAAVRAERPELYAAFAPWDRTTEPDAVVQLFREASIPDVEVIAEAGRQRLAIPDEWWTIVLGSGLRWTVDQLGPEAAARIKRDNLAWARTHAINEVETNTIYALARKPGVRTYRTR